MFGDTWQHDTLRKYVTYFGTLFNNIYLNRTDEDRITQTLKIPLSYGPKEKFLARAEGNEDLNRHIAIELPRMSFELMGMQYDPTRKLNKMNRLTRQSTAADSVDYMHMPVPYNLMFNLYVMVKNINDGNRIVEQIVPNFTPDFTASLDLVPDVAAPFDIPLVLDSVQSQDTYEGDFTQRRTLIWTLNFTMAGYLFGPIKQKKLIKFATTNFKVTSDPQNAPANTKNSVIINTYPGLLANGNPTSNASLTIPYGDIEADDDYGFIHEITEDL